MIESLNVDIDFFFNICEEKKIDFIDNPNLTKFMY
jgi:hypothetical protein